MKNAFAFTLALSVLASSAAFAGSQPVSASAVTAQTSHEQAAPVAQAGSLKTASAFKQALDSGTLVAETRHEFGSQYQRY